jgi:hypothetical protein
MWKTGSGAAVNDETHLPFNESRIIRLRTLGPPGYGGGTHLNGEYRCFLRPGQGFHLFGPSINFTAAVDPRRDSTMPNVHRTRQTPRVNARGAGNGTRVELTTFVPAAKLFC